jgi:3-hydroxyanthranilate 3,4-dioxygenase
VIELPPGFTMPIADLPAIAAELAASGRYVHVLWQQPQTLAFVARGRPYRSEFHINPSDEVMYMLRGEMRLHSRTPAGAEEIAVLREGSIIYTPGGIPHSPRFPPDAFALILERKRVAGEVDRFQWYCEVCDALLHEESFGRIRALLRERGAPHVRCVRVRHPRSSLIVDEVGPRLVVGAGAGAIGGCGVGGRSARAASFAAARASRAACAACVTSGAGGSTVVPSAAGVSG